jgi:hypothetical protein
MKTSTVERAARPAGATIPPGLARQQRERERTLRRLAKLRQKASDEIERLINFLDASDPYTSTEFEEQVDDEPCDTDELEMGWTGVTVTSPNFPNNGLGDSDESEADYGGREADYEPSLGSVDGPERGGQAHWAQGAGGDREEACEDEGVRAAPSIAGQEAD